MARNRREVVRRAGARPATSRRAARWGAARLSRRLMRSVPFVGTVVSLAYLGASMRRKGIMGGALDSGLNAIPFLGAAKNVAETVRGRDFIADRPSPDIPRRRRSKSRRRSDRATSGA